VLKGIRARIRFAIKNYLISICGEPYPEGLFATGDPRRIDGDIFEVDVQLPLPILFKPYIGPFRVFLKDHIDVKTSAENRALVQTAHRIAKNIFPQLPPGLRPPRFPDLSRLSKIDYFGLWGKALAFATESVLRTNDLTEDTSGKKYGRIRFDLLIDVLGPKDYNPIWVHSIIYIAKALCIRKNVDKNDKAAINNEVRFAIGMWFALLEEVAMGISLRKSDIPSLARIGSRFPYTKEDFSIFELKEDKEIRLSESIEIREELLVALKNVRGDPVQTLFTIAWILILKTKGDVMGRMLGI